MPIKYPFEVRCVSEQDFHELDYRIMGLAFSIHNEFGRLWDEKIYQNELRRRCLEMGVKSAETEAPIEISYKDFVKRYYVDLLLDYSVVYELKVVKALESSHQKQVLNYLFLLGLLHGKLVNFGATSVEHRFVSTTITKDERFDFGIDDKAWQNLDADSSWLKGFLVDLLQDWGAFLSPSLFYDAIAHFREGEENIIGYIDVLAGSLSLGRQKIYALNPDIAFKLTSITRNVSYYEKHLKRFLHHTKLKALQWINFNHHKIEFKTLI